MKLCYDAESFHTAAREELPMAGACMVKEDACQKVA